MSLLVSFGRIRTNLTSNRPKNKLDLYINKKKIKKTRQPGFAHYPLPCVIFHPLSLQLCLLCGFQRLEEISGS